MSNGKVSSVESLMRATIFLRDSVDVGQNGMQERDGISNHGDSGKSSRHSMANYGKDTQTQISLMAVFQVKLVNRLLLRFYSSICLEKGPSTTHGTSFLQAASPSCHIINSIKALKKRSEKYIDNN